ncbi:hypothetical protein [Variovorax boronicumulans]|uniref:hypothetical protein n=1 Tax=Variovorax boronicumulans TaxID=436515 RepID=UPI001C5804BA
MPQTAPTVALPPGVEIFRAGRHVDDLGTTHEFSEADVRRMVEVYDPEQREAPLTVGHPAHDLPAYGYVKSLAVNASGRLAMDTHQVPVRFAEMVRAGTFKKRSASFYPPSHPNNPTPGAWYLRHVAFLGAQPPAIAGLADIQFAEGDAEGVIQFSEPATQPTQEQDDMSKELQDKLAAAEKLAADEKAARELAERNAKDATDQLAQFSEAAKQTRYAAFVSFAEAQVKAGTILPKDKDMTVATLVLLSDATPVSFSEAGGTARTVAPSQWLQDLITSAKPLVNFGEFQPGAGESGQGEKVTAGSAKGKTDAEIDAAAKAYARDHKVSYAEAASAVVGFTS